MRCCRIVLTRRLGRQGGRWRSRDGGNGGEDVERAAEALAQFEIEAADWLAFDAFDGSQIGAIEASFLIGQFEFEQALIHDKPNLVNSCTIAVYARL